LNNKKLLPYKLVPGGLTMSPNKRYLMLNGSCSNLQDPSSMKSLGYINNVPNDAHFDPVSDNYKNDAKVLELYNH